MTLALGGGGARGVAHLGAIQGLLEAGYAVERIVGTSIGSLAAALYAFQPDIQPLQRRALQYLLSPEFAAHQQHLFGARPAAGEETTGGVFSWYHRIGDYLRANRMMYRVVRKPSLLPGVLMEEVVEHLLPDADIAEAQIPLSIVAVDLHSGRRVVLEKGPVRAAVCASAALPGIFPPVEIDGMLLCDIGVYCSVPLLTARAYDPELLVAVDVSSGLKPLTECATALDVLMRMEEIAEVMFRHHMDVKADLTITPDVDHVEWFDFTAAEELIAAGREAARQGVSKLEETAEPGLFSRWARALRPAAASLRGLLG